MASNGEKQSVTKAPPPPPLRNSKFCQSNMRILITGVAGFIGSHLVDRLMGNEKNELGMASALETLCGQAFGAGKNKMLGVYMQRSWVILLGTACLLTPLYTYSSFILQCFGTSKEIAEAAGFQSPLLSVAVFSTLLLSGCHSGSTRSSNVLLLTSFMFFTYHLPNHASWDFKDA